MVTLVEDKKELKCYVCGRSEKEFVSVFDPKKYDKKFFELESILFANYKIISSKIAAIYQKTEQYDPSTLIKDLEENERIYSKFMPDWRELLKFLSYEFKTRSSQNASIAYIRSILLDATLKLDKGERPENIQVDELTLEKEKAFKMLKIKREKLHDLIANPLFLTYETVVREIKDEQNKLFDTINVNYSLCPVCVDLHTKYHNAIKAANDDSYGWDD